MIAEVHRGGSKVVGALTGSIAVASVDHGEAADTMPRPATAAQTSQLLVDVLGNIITLLVRPLCAHLLEVLRCSNVSIPAMSRMSNKCPRILGNVITLLVRLLRTHLPVLLRCSNVWIPAVNECSHRCSVCWAMSSHCRCALCTHLPVLSHCSNIATSATSEILMLVYPCGCPASHHCSGSLQQDFPVRHHR